MTVPFDIGSTISDALTDRVSLEGSFFGPSRKQPPNRSKSPTERPVIRAEIKLPPAGEWPPGDAGEDTTPTRPGQRAGPDARGILRAAWHTLRSSGGELGREAWWGPPIRSPSLMSQRTKRKN